MNFFEHQDKARRQTRLLVLLFIIALIVVVLAVDMVALSVVANISNQTGRLILPGPGWAANHAGLITLVSLATTAFIAMASLFRIATLGSGGGKVARSLGGTLVPPDTQDPLLRRLYNVVEEMAIASGVPVPEIYVLEEEAGLNAFAAGFTSGDAAIAVTRGSLDSFNRSELQGVIAHEFSHILNGDMRLNMRMMGVLFGILVISIIGRTILRSAQHARLSTRGYRNKGGSIAAGIAIGMALAVIGYLGLFLTRIIKAGVSRQREYLADASAVQFTRRTDGIAGALKQIGYGNSSRIQAPQAEEISHMLFANGLPGFSSLHATHPPIDARIRALEPGFDPEACYRDMATKAAMTAPASTDNWDAEQTDPNSTRAQWNRLMESLIVLTPDAVSSSIGNPQQQHIQHAAELRRLIPDRLNEAAHSHNDVLLLVIGLLLDRKFEIRERQLAPFSALYGRQQLSLISTLHTKIQELDPSFRLPLMELAFPALKQRPREQILAFVGLVDELIQTDGKVDSFEYLLSRALLSHLRDADRPGRTRTYPRMKLVNSVDELHILFSTVALLGHNADDEAARDAYQIGMLALLPNKVDWPDYQSPEKWAVSLDSALDTLDGLPAVIKEELIKALSQTISHDGTVTVSEAELLRAVCTILHCPLPPLVPDKLSLSPQMYGPSSLED